MSSYAHAIDMLYKWSKKRPKTFIYANPLMENGTNGA